jgi:hypothetical protein
MRTSATSPNATRPSGRVVQRFGESNTARAITGECRCAVPGYVWARKVQFFADVRKVQALNLEQWVPERLATIMQVSTTAIVRGCKAHGHLVVNKPVLHY